MYASIAEKEQNKNSTEQEGSDLNRKLSVAQVKVGNIPASILLPISRLVTGFFKYSVAALL